ncbi:nitroreductase family protein [Vibrio splendidus]
MLSIIKRIFPNILSTGSIYISYISDARRFVRFNTNNRVRLCQNKSSALLIRASHGLEKAFSLPDMKASFGEKQAIYLIDLVISVHSKFGNLEEIDEAVNILNNYFLYHGDLLSNELFLSKKRFEKFVSENDLLISNVDCYAYFKPEINFILDDYERFVESRHSVRNFREGKVSPDIIKKSVNIALNTPSACNRQPWRIRILQDQELIRQALSIQNGNRGFSSNISNIAIITGKISCFSSKERHQVYIDCGLFSMSFIHSLHASGLGACALNLSYHAHNERNVRTILGLDDDDALIMMIAFGYVSPNAKYSQSKRLGLDRILSFDS